MDTSLSRIGTARLTQLFVIAVLAGALTPSSALGQRVAQPVQTAPAPAQQSAPSKGPGAAQVTAKKGPRTVVLSSTKQTKYAPNRVQALQAQIALRDAENAIAQSARRVAASATAAPPLTPSPRAVTVPAGALSPPPTRPKVETAAGSMNTPTGIWSVNNKEKNFTLTPGGFVTIVGKGFGDGGQVSMFVLAQGGTLEIPFQVQEWHDREIYAFVPAGIRSIVDQPTRLQVRTRTGAAYSLGTGRFYAVREEITVGTGLARVIWFAPSPNWSASLADNGRVDRDQDGGCGSPGNDRLYFKPLANGFVVSGIAWWTGRQDSGDGDGDGHEGARAFKPGYSFGAWGTGSMAVGRDRSVQVPTLTLNWGVWCVTHESGGLYSNSNFTSAASSSNYQVEVSLIGPAGLSPF